MENQTILSVENISVSFHVRHRELKAIRNVSLELKEKETLAIVGESGSGKSVLTKTFTGCWNKTAISLQERSAIKTRY